MEEEIKEKEKNFKFVNDHKKEELKKKVISLNEKNLKKEKLFNELDIKYQGTCVKSLELQETIKKLTQGRHEHKEERERVQNEIQHLHKKNEQLSQDNTNYEEEINRFN